MHRIAYSWLKSWKRSPKRKPLLLQGARQVGKTYLLRRFGEKEYENLAYFNFEETPELISLFDGDLLSQRLLEALSAFSSQQILSHSSLLFLDEIQLCPRAITSLKYFQEQSPGLHIVCAGSLLGVSVGKNSSFPVGKVNFMNLQPLCFAEFLSAIGEDGSRSLLEKKRDLEALPALLHNRLGEIYQKFLYVGGMPEVVQYYVNERDFVGVREIQKEILEAYERDFSKYAKAHESIRIQEIWRSIPTQLAKENTKFVFRAVREGSRASQYASAIEWLRAAGLIYLVYNIKTPKIPLSAYIDRSKIKLLLLDSGLLGAMLDLPSTLIALPNTLFGEYNGAFIENSIGNELIPHFGNELYYWTSKSAAEVDYLLGLDGFITPLEVKSGMNRNIKSLRSYAERYKTGQIFRVSPRNFTLDGDFCNIPLYSAGFLKQYLVQ